MANVVISPNMNLPVPTVATDIGPDWANNINACMGGIDSHNHTSGQGVQLTPAAFNINAALPFNGNAAVNVAYVNLDGAAPTPTINASVYSDGTDLFYRDGSGNLIRITQSGSVAGASGTITGLPSGTASAAFSSGSGSFVFQQATSTGANLDVASIAIRYPGSYPTPSGNFIQLQAPSALATGYALTLPSALPGTSGAFLTTSSAGAVGYTNVDNSTLAITSNLVGVKALGITAAQVANSTLTITQMAASVPNAIGVAMTVTGANAVLTTSDTGAPLGPNYPIVSRVPSSSGLGRNYMLFATVTAAGSILSGSSGVSATRTTTGTYAITFTASFGSLDIPTVVGSVNDNQTGLCRVSNITHTGCIIEMFDMSGGGVPALANMQFGIIAMG